MRRLFFLFLLISQSIVFSQQISFSKDSVYIYNSADSIYIYNKGETALQVDSVKSNHIYAYSVYAIFSDSTKYYNVVFTEPGINFSLAPQDSVMLIFNEPDLCPFCDINVLDYFTDTLTFFSNSLTNSEFGLSVSGEGLSDVNDETNSVSDFKLYQNYPNPFSKGTNGNSVTTINYSIPNVGIVKTEHIVSLRVYNILGKEIATLVNKQQAPGKYSVTFNARNLPAGMYFYTLQVGNFTKTKKMILLH